MEIIGTISEIIKTKGSEVYTTTPDATVFEAVKLMGEKNIGALLVIDNGKLAGVISERDYSRKIALRGKNSHVTRVREILSTPVISVSSRQTVQECMQLMTKHRIRHLPVLEGQAILGIVSIGDLVNWIISAQQQAISQLQNYISGQYPG